jgi:hypothetical protein
MFAFVMTVNKFLFLSLLFSVLNLSINANTVYDTLYIQRAVHMIGPYATHFCTFSSSETFDIKNKNFTLSTDDLLHLTIINSDTVMHTFTINDIFESNNILPPADTLTVELQFSNPGTYAYYSDFPYGKGLGASGIISVGWAHHQNFFWNLFDQDVALSEELANGNALGPPANYRPELFLINNLSYPATTSDMDVLIMGMVGDTLIINIHNSGKMNHTIHFHGYHVKILHAKKYQHYIGWIKDSFPVLIDEVMTVELIPDKPGMFPVHDHNLVTVTTIAYPGGMMTMLHIME